MMHQSRGCRVHDVSVTNTWYLTGLFTCFGSVYQCIITRAVMFPPEAECGGAPPPAQVESRWWRLLFFCCGIISVVSQPHRHITTIWAGRASSPSLTPTNIHLHSSAPPPPPTSTAWPLPHPLTSPSSPVCLSHLHSDLRRRAQGESVPLVSVCLWLGLGGWGGGRREGGEVYWVSCVSLQLLLLGFCSRNTTEIILVVFKPRLWAEVSHVGRLRCSILNILNSEEEKRRLDKYFSYQRHSHTKNITVMIHNDTQ